MLTCFWHDRECYALLKQSIDVSAAEHLNRTIEDLQKKADAYANAVRQLKNRELELLKGLESMEKEKEECKLLLKAQKDGEITKDKELVQLRNFVYQLESEPVVHDNLLDSAITAMQQMKILVIGGHNTWQGILRDYNHCPERCCRIFLSGSPGKAWAIDAVGLLCGVYKHP